MKEIPVSENDIALVDDDDYVELAQYDWYARKQEPDICYAIRYERQANGSFRPILMHRQILGLEYGDDTVVTAHMNGNRLDNQRSNLRACARMDVARLSRRKPGRRSRFRGVDKVDDGGWQASINCGALPKKYLGRFENERDAALCYDKHAREYYGEFAVLNFPDITEYHLPEVMRGPTSEFRGVSWDNYYGKWLAVIKLNGVTTHVGRFHDEKHAALAYDKAARKLHGRKAKLNFPEITRYRLPKRRHTSKYRGVHWVAGSKCWRARIEADNRQRYIGMFRDEAEAGRAYDRVAARFHGERAKLNFRYTPAQIEAMKRAPFPGGAPKLA